MIIEKLESWKIGMMTGLGKLIRNQKSIFPSIRHSTIPIKLNHNSSKTYYNFNHKK